MTNKANSAILAAAALTATGNPFDFTTVDDLPEELRAKVAVATASQAAVEWAAVVVKSAEFGLKSVDINQIMAAAHRMGMEVPTAQTVRGYLNKAAEQGLISKPTRQTYAAPLPKTRAKAEDIGLGDALVVTGEVPVTEAVAVVPVDADPLADLLK